MTTGRLIAGALAAVLLTATAGIDQIAALEPEVVVAGHEGPGATRDMRSIEFMKQYRRASNAGPDMSPPSAARCRMAMTAYR
jgi:hypothetical protein